MEYNTQKYQFNQDGRDYVVSTGLVGDRIRITCQESLALDGPFYSNEFSLDDLRHANQFFLITQTPEEALMEINKGIERQKSGLAQGPNDTMSFLGYLVIGTDNDMYNLPLRRDYEPNKYGIFTPPSTGAADLVLQSNYQVDGGRLNVAESTCGDLQRDQTELEEELNNIIPEINKLRKLSLDIKEENALIKERLKILQDQLEERKRSVFKLKEENEILKRENQELNNYIRGQEQAIREKQALQTTVKVKSRPNISHGRSAITSKFEQSALRTFLPRTGVKPITEDYIQNTTYNIPSNKGTIISSEPIVQTEPTQQYIIPSSTENVLQTKYLPPITLQEEHPDVGYSTKPNLGDDMNYSSQQYSTSPNIYSYNNKTIPYTSSNYGINGNIPYTSSKMGRIDDGGKNASYSSYGRKDAPYSSYGSKNVPYSSYGRKDATYSSGRIGKGDNYNKNVPYTSTQAQNDYPYSSTRAQKDNTYTSAQAQNDYPYSSTKAQKDNTYTSAQAQNDYPYSSTRAQKDNAYTSTQAQKDAAYNSKMSTGSNIAGYSSQMAKNLGDSANEGYSSQMGKTAERYIQGTSSKRPKGSRAPNMSYSSKNHQSKSPDTGYTSYK